MYHVRIIDDSHSLPAEAGKPRELAGVGAGTMRVASGLHRLDRLRRAHAEAAASDSAVRAGVNERRPIVRNAMPARTHSTPAIQNAGS